MIKPRVFRKKNFNRVK